MRLVKLAFLCALMTPLLFSCARVPYLETEIDCPEGTKVVAEAPPEGFVRYCMDEAGHTQGQFTAWFPNGRKRLECNYKDGVPHGTCREWYKNGYKKGESEFESGQEIGKWIYWNENGGLERTVVFSHSKGKRIETVFFASGAKQAEGELRRHLIRHGPWTFWHENGQKKSEGEYRDHKKHGLWIEWDERGQEIRRTVYHNGVENSE